MADAGQPLPARPSAVFNAAMPRHELQHRHLEVFRAVIRGGSATGAARLLGISQPAVSKLLSQTEALAGFALFERLHGRLVPNRRAVRLFEETERLFVGMEEIGHLLGRIRAEEPLRAVIASVPVLAQELLPLAARRWLEDDNRERLAVTTRDAGGVLALVTARHAEVGLASTPLRVPGIRSSVLLRSRSFCALPPGHRLASHAVIRPADLRGEAFVALSRHEQRQQPVDRILEANGVRVREVAECPLSAGAAAMAAAGVGITFADVFAARPFLERGLVLRPFEPAITVEHRAIWADGTKPRFDRNLFIALLRDAAQTVAAEVSAAIRSTITGTKSA